MFMKCLSLNFVFVTLFSLMAMANQDLDFDARMSKVVWAPPTNGVSVGLVAGATEGSLKYGFTVILTNHTDEDVVFVIPERRSLFNMNAFSADGVKLPRTKLELGWPLEEIESSINPKSHQDKVRRRQFLRPHEALIFDTINLEDYFLLGTNKSPYRIEYQQRFQQVVVRTNDVMRWKCIAFPNATITVRAAAVRH